VLKQIPPALKRKDSIAVYLINDVIMFLLSLSHHDANVQVSHFSQRNKKLTGARGGSHTGACASLK